MPQLCYDFSESFIPTSAFWAIETIDGSQLCVILDGGRLFDPDNSLFVMQAIMPGGVFLSAELFRQFAIREETLNLLRNQPL